MDISKKLQRLREEDFIWIVYFFISVAALYSNYLERKFYIKNDKISYKKQKTINITILVITFFIYLYYLLIVTEDIQGMEKNFNNPKYRQTFTELIAAILFLIGGAIYAILEITETNLNFDEIGLI